MFDHVRSGVSDSAARRAFFLQALAPLGVAVVSEGARSCRVGLGTSGKPALCRFQTREKPAHLRLAFRAKPRRQMDAFHCAALAAGGTGHGAPGLHPHDHTHYHAAFVIEPDGHNTEVVCNLAEG